MSWYDTLTSTPALIAGALGLTASAYLYTRNSSPIAAPAAPAAAVQPAAHAHAHAKPASTQPTAKQSAGATVAEKSDPITVAELAKHDGKDASKPIYVAIKGKVYDVTNKKEMYGPGAGYNVFAGKDASRGLGMSSLDPKDAVSDYSTLNEKEMKTLDQWDSFFAKRYNIVGKVVP